MQSANITTLRVLAAPQRQQQAAGPAPRRLGAALRPSSMPAAARRVAAAASSKELDFDELLNTVAAKFERVDNKPVVVGYLVAAFFAITTAEWLIHLPLLNILLGWPIQFLGLVVAPYLALRYYVDKSGDPLDDAEFLVGKYTEKLPGLKK